ncbi:hypothetical protein VZT92_025066 [Zoarces viviparus]|uniref:Uncharacterized protein n=1 Tax=Zoarces viviparus TaxID=48416 RepID=A0AAW1E652_ZOAVI
MIAVTDVFTTPPLPDNFQQEGGVRFIPDGSSSVMSQQPFLRWVAARVDLLPVLGGAKRDVGAEPTLARTPSNEP